MVVVIWGFVPLLIPAELISILGLHLSKTQITLMRVWGIIVLLDTFVYIYIFKRPHSKLSKYLLIFSVLDNGGIGLLLLLLTPIFKFPWGIWINVPFQLFFGYWFWKFYKEGDFTK
ncbi:hypothetical protein KBB12_01440 [Candidatus Woesebacteria bacterium]|nr:hypothetical protein [Candidatus Woesebacteria bacterium]